MYVYIYVVSKVVDIRDISVGDDFVGLCD
jgi:hypothetical protein